MTARPKLPETVTCGPFTYDVWQRADLWDALMTKLVREGDTDPDCLWGYTDHLEGAILLNPQMTLTLSKVILLHEVLHLVVFAASGWADGRDDALTEEDWVVRAAPTLADVFQRNPSVVKYLSAA